MVHNRRPMAVVVMGVQGCGKSTIGEGVAAALGADFVDGDDLHSAEARASMASGRALTDEDRWPWLHRVGERLAAGLADGRGVVIACSALKRAYREVLRAHCPELRIVFLDGAADVLRSRVAGRSHEYMPATLLDSQLATLEIPGPGELDVVRVDIDAPPPAVIAAAVAGLTGA